MRATFAISASKHGGQLVNGFLFIYSEVITLGPGYLMDKEFSQWLLSSLDQKSFLELVFNAVKNRKRSGYVDCQ